MHCTITFGQKNHIDVKGGYANKSIIHLTLERGDLLSGKRRGTSRQIRTSSRRRTSSPSRISLYIYLITSYQCHQEQEDLQVGEDRLQAAHRVLRLWQLKVHVDLRNKKYEVNVDNKTSLWSMLIWIKTIQYVTYMTRQTCWRTWDLESAEERDSDEDVGDDEGGQIVGLLWTSFNHLSVLFESGKL